MTNPKWLIGIAAIFALFSLICGVLEGSYLGPNEVGRLAALMTWPGIMGIPTWIGNLWSMLWFDYACFHGGWLIIKYVFFWPVSIGLVVSYGALLLPYLVAGARSILSGLAGLLGLGGA
jgi:hypothetical protein